MKLTVTALKALLVVAIFFTTATGCTTSTRVIKSEFSITASESSVPQKPLVSNNSPADTPKTFSRVKPEDYKSTILRLIPLAEQGDADAQYSVGYMLYNGMGTPENISQAVTWLIASANQGNGNAVIALRRIALAGRNIDENASENIGESILITPEYSRLFSGDVNDDFQSTNPSTNQPTIYSERVSTIEPSSLIMSGSSSDVDSTPDSTVMAMFETLPKKTLTSYSKSERWILRQPEQHYTIQLIASSNENALKRFIRDNNLGNNAAYYQTKRNSESWYTLILGSYETINLAQSAIDNLSTSLKATSPWVKSITDIQETLTSR
ncbi:MAG: SPOR domain-containing protein [Ectothiorhodospiraceae bacterium]|nr:SPOR domain-containing protein [Ectothiorhodospiraceae bacterium]